MGLRRKKCPKCGKMMNANETFWDCPNCGEFIVKSKYAKAEEKNKNWLKNFFGDKEKD